MRQCLIFFFKFTINIQGKMQIEPEIEAEERERRRKEYNKLWMQQKRNKEFQQIRQLRMGIQKFKEIVNDCQNLSQNDHPDLSQFIEPQRPQNNNRRNAGRIPNDPRLNQAQRQQQMQQRDRLQRIRNGEAARQNQQRIVGETQTLKNLYHGIIQRVKDSICELCIQRMQYSRKRIDSYRSFIRHKNRQHKFVSSFLTLTFLAVILIYFDTQNIGQSQNRSLLQASNSLMDNLNGLNLWCDAQKNQIVQNKKIVLIDVNRYKNNNTVISYWLKQANLTNSRVNRYFEQVEEHCLNDSDDNIRLCEYGWKKIKWAYAYTDILIQILEKVSERRDGILEKEDGLELMKRKQQIDNQFLKVTQQVKKRWSGGQPIVNINWERYKQRTISNLIQIQEIKRYVVGQL